MAVNAELYDTSIELLEKAVSLDRKNAAFRNNLANSYILSDQPEKALPHLRRAISITPRLTEPLMNMARACRAAGESNKAIDWYQKVLIRDPDSGPAKTGLGEALADMGRMDEAIAVLRDGIATAGDPIPAAIALSSAFEFTEDDIQDVHRIEALVHGDGAEEKGIIALKHALGKINNDLKRYDAAFHLFAEAKELAGANFDIRQYRKHIDGTIAYFTPSFYRQKKDLGDRTDRPVFIVGMPRSGTTLTEQILSSHARVKGAGELQDMERIVRRINPTGPHRERFYQTLSRMKPEDSQKIAQVYLAVLRRHSRTALRVVDKTPHNFELLGLIAMLFPNARVIYCKRDPMDNCVSCFMQHFSEFHGYNSNLKNLGLYYRQHVRLMDHWKAVLPIEILESRYEDLIADQEPMSRRLIEFIGLEWDDACLQFHTQERSVKTLSRWQVRQPIYATSMKRWKRYDQHLGPLKEALGDLFVDG